MRRPFFTSSFILSMASGAVASPEIVRSYDIIVDQLAAQDRACLNALVDEVAINFEGLERIVINNGAYVMPTQTGYLASYVGVIFEGQYGNAKGAVSCLYAADGTRVTDISVNFEGRGLAGFKRHPLAFIISDPTERKAVGLGAQIEP